MSATTKLLASIMPPAVSSVIGRTFDFMEIAEEEIKRAMSTRTKKTAHGKRQRERINATFGKLMPGVLVELTDAVYRHHCRELLSRAARDEDLRPGTEAEVLHMLMQTSFQAPLNSQGQALYERLFKSIFGSLPEDWELTPDAWNGAAEEMLHGARKRLARDR